MHKWAVMMTNSFIAKIFVSATNLFAILAAVVFFYTSQATNSHAASLELQQMRASLQQLQDIGVEIPEDLENLLNMMEEEQTPRKDNDNIYGKKLSKMTCSDNISGLWKTTNNLATFDLQPNGKGLLYSTDKSGLYYTKTSLQWDASGSEFYVDYDYIRTYETHSNILQSETKPKNETVSCKYMGSMLNIGGQLYKR